jgi:pyruvate/2-oxoglutarate/acetoin dehydrogenase E1 component
LPLGKAEVIKTGKDVTVLGYGLFYHIFNGRSQIYALENAISMVICGLIV